MSFKGFGGPIAVSGNGAIRTYNVFIGTPANSTIPLVSSAEYPFTILEIDNLHTSAGTITLTMQINGTNVTGLSSLSVTTTPQSPTTSGANTVNVGDRLTMVLASNSSAANLEFTMKATL